MAVSAPVRIRRSPAPRVPRRVSGPIHRPDRGVVETPPLAGKTAVRAPGVVGRVIAISRGRLIDRLIRGRLWIPTLAVALMGIVFMQVSMLSMNAGIGRTVSQSATLSRENDALRAELSRVVLANGVTDTAAAAGMVVPGGPDDYHVLTAGKDDARRAAASLTPPQAPVQPSVVAPVVPLTTEVTPTPATNTTATQTSQTQDQTTSAPTTSSDGSAATVTPTASTTITPGGGTAAPEG